MPDFIDEWVSAPYPQQVKDRPIIMNGLNALGAHVLNATPDQRKAALSALPTSNAPHTQAFWKKFRHLTIGAYYTTEAGFKDIGYIGNVPRTIDPGPSAEVKMVLENQLKKLGL